MSNELTVFQSANALQKFGTEAINDIGGTFLPYIKIMTGNAQEVKTGKIGVGNFAMFENQVMTDLTKSFNAVIVVWRPKTMTFEQGTNNCDFSFDPSSDKFQKMKSDALNGYKGACYGKEYLLYLPKYGKFACLYLGNKSGRFVTGSFDAMLGKQVTIESILNTSKGGETFFGPQVKPCSLPMENQPSPDEIEMTVSGFNTPSEKSAITEDSADVADTGSREV